MARRSEHGRSYQDFYNCGMPSFRVQSEVKPAGGRPRAIDSLVAARQARPLKFSWASPAQARPTAFKVIEKLHLLLRLLPARGLRPLHRHLHREGLRDQRPHRPPAPEGHQLALSRRDVIVVASVSCIYNIGSPENYGPGRPAGGRPEGDARRSSAALVDDPLRAQRGRVRPRGASA